MITIVKLYLNNFYVCSYNVFNKLSPRYFKKPYMLLLYQIIQKRKVNKEPEISCKQDDWSLFIVNEGKE